MLLVRRRLLLALVALCGCPAAARKRPAPSDRNKGPGIQPERSSTGLAVESHERAPAGLGLSEASEIEFWFGGDLHLGDLDPEVLAPLREIVSPNAIGVLNLEGPIAASSSEPQFELGEVPVLRNSESVPEVLRDLGVGVVGVANNHADDYGAVGRRATISLLRAANLVAVGGDAGVAMIEREGIRLAITAHYVRPGERPKFADELREARVRADHLIVTFHVDGPPSYLPSSELRAAVEVAVAASASLIIAHGSHALARLERREGSVIAWGLGNLAFACPCTDEIDAALLRVRLRRNALTLVEWIPIEAGLGGDTVAQHPEPALLIDLLASLGSSSGQRVGGRYRLDL